MTSAESQLTQEDDPGSAAASELYRVRDGQITHRVEISGRVLESHVMSPSEPDDDLKGAWWRSYLAGNIPEANQSRGRVRTVDLFSGPGGLALGFRQGCAEMGVAVVSELAVDEDVEATHVYAANHQARAMSNRSVSTLIDYRVKGQAETAAFSYDPELIDPAIASAVKGVDVVLAGPPCQGHSNLNNQTRRTDRRNELYLTVPAFAVAANVPVAIIENVPMVLHDSDKVVETAKRLFETAGYTVTMGMLSAVEMGWPQTRKRHFMIARRDVPPVPLADVRDLLQDEHKRSIWWAIGGLGQTGGDDFLHQTTELSDENQARVAWLHDHDEYDLPPSERPKSHRDGTTYTAVYGRLYKDRPAPTITTGFFTPGRGRYIHPTQRRVLTAREAARIQGFPDTYDFRPDPGSPPTKVKLSKWIGDAVPMPLGYAAAMSALAPGLPS